MNKTIKRLDVYNARLFVISAGKRINMADFEGEVIIEEHQKEVSILGTRCKGEKKIYASFLVSDEIQYNNDEEFHSGKVYEAIGTVQGEEKSESLIFAGLRFEDIDPISGSITFEITDLELIQKMLNM